jgi:molybdenum cofactor cytidylyltransferase
MKARPVVVVLAAGQGSRFGAGAHKLVQPLGTSSVLGEVLRHVLASHLGVVVVTIDALADEARRTIASKDVVLVPAVGSLPDGKGGATLGMGYSIAVGVGARPEASGWLIVPADMPLVRPTTLVTVARQLEHHAVVYAQHGGRRGHPVGFSSELYSELVALQGDEGARRLLARFPAHGVEVDDPGVLVDIDTEADLLAARAGQVGRADAMNRHH